MASAERGRRQAGRPGVETPLERTPRSGPAGVWQHQAPNVPLHSRPVTFRKRRFQTRLLVIVKPSMASPKR